MSTDDWIKEMARYLVDSWGISRQVASNFATLYLYFHYYGLSPQITSGYRSQSYQDKLRKQWDSGNRAGLAVRPAAKSSHTSKTAMDIKTNNPALAAQIAKALGFKAGYYFKNSDPVHFQRT